jgi:hypothetical protein
MRNVAPPGYHTVELNERVPNVEVETFRWKWKAERRCRKLNATRLIDTYRHEVHQRIDGRWDVAAMQNQAVPNQ